MVVIKGTSAPAGSMFIFLNIIGKIIPTIAAVVQETMAERETTRANLTQKPPLIRAIMNIPKPIVKANNITVESSLQNTFNKPP
jgi:hypothetical protein